MDRGRPFASAVIDAHAPGGRSPRLDIVTLGLEYGVELGGAVARVTHTLTTPGCPMARIIGDGIQRAALAVEGIDEVETRVVWDPAWHPGMIAPNAFPV